MGFLVLKISAKCHRFLICFTSSDFFQQPLGVGLMVSYVFSHSAWLWQEAPCVSSVLGNQERMSEVELELQAVVDLPLPSTRSLGAGSQPSLSGGTAHVLTWGAYFKSLEDTLLMAEKPHHWQWTVGTSVELMRPWRINSHVMSWGNNRSVTWLTGMGSNLIPDKSQCQGEAIFYD